MENPDPNSNHPIEQYRSQSWQIEMLIAGGVLFSLYNFGDHLRLFFLSTEPHVIITTNQIIIFLGIYVLTTVLLIGFAANLILRTVWLGYLGLTFVFKDGVNYDALKGKETYTKRLKTKLTAAERVSILETWCKLSFSFAVLLALFVLSLIITVSFVMFLISLISVRAGDTTMVSYTVVFILALLQLGILDRWLIPGKKKGKAQAFTHGIRRFLNIASLSFLYKREALVLKTNVKKWILYGFSLTYLTAAILFSVQRVGEFYVYGTFNLDPLDQRSYYDVGLRPKVISNEYDSNLTEKDRIQYASIQSDIIKDNYLRVFIVSWKRFDKELGKNLKEGSYKTYLNSSSKDYLKLRAKNDTTYKQALNNFFRLSIDSTSYSGDWYTYEHPKTKEEGFVTYLNIDSLSSDKHMLNINLAYGEGDSTTAYRYVFIPFWKE